MSKSVFFSVLALPIVLAACSSNEDAKSDTTSAPAGVPLSSVVEAISSNASLENFFTGEEETFTLGSSSKLIERNFAEDSTSVSDRAAVTVEIDHDAETMIFTLNGRKFVVSEDDAIPEGAYKIVESDGEHYFWFNGGDLADFADGTSWMKFATTIGYSGATENKDIWARGYFPIGFQAPNAAIQGKAAATYTGYMRTTVFDVTDPGNSTGRFDIRGDVNLSADFDAGTVSGAIVDVTVETNSSGTKDSIDDTFSITSTELDGVSFTSEISNNCVADCSVAINSSSVNGVFYGDTAQEAAGTIEANVLIFSDTEINAAGVGHFQVQQD